MSSPKPLSGKVALITGASKGIGRATALRLARDGAKVVINYANGAAAAEEVVQLIGADSAIAIKADASNISSIKSLINTTVEKWGRIDILVANAGIMALNELESVSEEEFDKTFNSNVKGPLFLAQKAAPHMPKGSRIILFSTTLCAASTVTPNYLAYVSSKGAIEQMTRVMSKDLARKGITVNCIAPGPTATDLFFKGKSEQILTMMKGLNPQGRLGTPEDIAEVVAMVSGEGSAWVTGQIIRVNGGMA